MMQFVSIRFNALDRRTYTYHNDKSPVAIGDQVKVITNDGPKIVEVIGISDQRPPFATKPIELIGGVQ